MIKNKKADKREFILSEAAKLFKQKGYGASSMRDLAEQVGLDAASMYHYISSKDEILKTICFKIAHHYLSHLSEMEHQNISYTQKLKALVRLHIQVMVSNAAEVSVANNDWKYLSAQALNEFKELRRTYERRLEALIEDGVKAGELEPVHTPVALFTLLSAVRWVELWWRPNRGISTDELENSIITILFNGLERK